jgi:diadenosine tetraphosphate (Ap4A) HIT family hydrolase
MKAFDHTCEFCNEQLNFAESRIGKIYTNYFPNRVIKQTKHFFVVPTIGQIVPGSLLILPIWHYETFAQVPKQWLLELSTLISEIENTYFKDSTLLFEHGAKKSSNNSCGVYHAHIHLIPVKESIIVEDLLGTNISHSVTLQEAFKELESKSNYILSRDKNGDFYYSIGGDPNKEEFKSQYFRKWLVSRFASDRNWDWKRYDFIEKDILTILSPS